ncbi:MAG: hypothetical protein R6U58_10160 [Bacteroidales bacterium]
MTVVTASDNINPSGILRSGFFISSAMPAIFVSPRKETKTSPTVEISPSNPFGKNGV